MGERKRKAIAAALAAQGIVESKKPKVERLVAVAIMRDGEMTAAFERGSHFLLRDSMTPPIAAGDIDGFKTSEGRFVNRSEAQDVAIAAGQIRSHRGRPLLSSDIDW